jgi:hypothetical protein
MICTVYSARVDADGRVQLDGIDVAKEWPSVAALAADYLRYERLSGEAKEADDMAAWECVFDLVSEPAWAGAVNLIDELLRQANEDEVGMIAAGPLEELVVPREQGPRFIDAIEVHAREDQRWIHAVASIWFNRDASADVNQRLAVFGARRADGSMPS